MPDIQQELMIQPEEAKLAAQSMTPMDLLQMAVQKGVDIDQLSKLMELQERWAANQARMAFNEAMAKFKANPPEITKNKHVKFGNTEYDHATLDHVTDAITKALSDVGICHRWSTAQNGPEIAVTCLLTHELGHSEGTTLKASPDTSGSKNAIQAIGSAVTYLQRYTLMAACGLAARGADDDAATAGGVAADWLDERVDWIANCRDVDELKKIYSDAYREAGKAHDQKAMHALLAAKNRRKAELQ